MSTKPVRTLDELCKMKFRVPPSPVMIKMVESWGISPTLLVWSELFNAVQLDVVDAFEVDDSVLISAAAYFRQIKNPGPENQDVYIG
jgi:TRAP-type C4-dicarboxylate transport system substrate-binding protein